ncbi:MAG: glycosyltransferase family 9 protein [Rhabdochlamydiaceae bacterium]
MSTTGLGDSLWADPAIKALKRACPDARLFLLTSFIGKEVFKEHPDIERIFLFKKSCLSFFSQLYQLRKWQVHTAIIFHISQRIAVPLTLLSGADVTISSQGLNKGLDDLFQQIVSVKKEHEIERRLRLVAFCETKKVAPKLSFFIEKESLSFVDKFLENFKTQNFICFHMGGKDLFKRWSLENFIHLGQLISEKYPHHILLTGDQKEKKLADIFCQQVAKSFNVCGLFDLHQTAALIQKTNLMITNDTGPMHISFALDKPTIAIFGPTDPFLCGPWKTKKGIVMQTHATCFPCLKKKCQEPFCLLQISPKQVFDQADQILSSI